MIGKYLAPHGEKQSGPIMWKLFLLCKRSWKTSPPYKHTHTHKASPTLKTSCWKVWWQQTWPNQKSRLVTAAVVVWDMDRQHAIGPIIRFLWFIKPCNSRSFFYLFFFSLSFVLSLFFFFFFFFFFNCIFLQYLKHFCPLPFFSFSFFLVTLIWTS